MQCPSSCGPIMMVVVQNCAMLVIGLFAIQKVQQQLEKCNNSNRKLCDWKSAVSRCSNWWMCQIIVKIGHAQCVNAFDDRTSLARIGWKETHVWRESRKELFVPICKNIGGGKTAGTSWCVFLVKKKNLRTNLRAMQNITYVYEDSPNPNPDNSNERN